MGGTYTERRWAKLFIEAWLPWSGLASGGAGPEGALGAGPSWAVLEKRKAGVGEAGLGSGRYIKA